MATCESTIALYNNKVTMVCDKQAGMMMALYSSIGQTLCMFCISCARELGISSNGMP